MKEYIEREAILHHKRKMRGFDLNEEFWDEAVLCEEIKQIPAADVAPVVHGEWIPRGNWFGHIEYRCSACKSTVFDADDYDYCPFCGAKMRGVATNE